MSTQKKSISNEELLAILQSGDDQALIDHLAEVKDVLYEYLSKSTPDGEGKSVFTQKTKYGTYSYSVDKTKKYGQISVHAHIVFDEGIESEEDFVLDLADEQVIRTVKNEFHRRVETLAYSNMDKLTEKHLRQLVRDTKDPDVVMAAVRMGLDTEQFLQIAIVESKYISVDGLREMEHSPYLSVRQRIAKRDDAPEDVLDYLSKDKEREVRIWVARNDHTAHNTLMNLSDDKVASVRASVAFNKECPLDILFKLATDPNVNVRKEVVSNFNIDREIMNILEMDESEDLQKTIQAHKKLANQHAFIRPSPWASDYQPLA